MPKNKNPYNNNEKNRRKYQISREEALLWQKFTENVEPLAGKMIEIPDEELNKEKIKSIAEPILISKDIMQKIINRSSHKNSDNKNKPYLHTGNLSNIDGSTANKFSKGKYPIDARLDLHGMYQDAARESVVNLINHSYATGRRCVLIITGKGQESEGKTGVIKDQLPRWLNMPDLRPKILGFSLSRPQHGGNGAFYVMIKKKKCNYSAILKQ
jgi:DNA-nicking Smr family endonuclease